MRRSYKELHEKLFDRVRPRQEMVRLIYQWVKADMMSPRDMELLMEEVLKFKMGVPTHVPERSSWEGCADRQGGSFDAEEIIRAQQGGW